MIATILILVCCTMLPTASQATLSADPSGAVVSPPSIPDNEETRALLEQSLSAAEIEQEIIRITAEQEVLGAKVSQLSKQAEEKKLAIVDKQERAGAIVRSYYMGDRDGLLVAFLSAKSISKVLVLYDYYETIIGREHDILKEYEDQYKDLKATLTANQRSSNKLAELKRSLEEQKVRVAELNKKIDSGVRDSSDPEKMNALLQEFTLYWENIGIHEVNTYFKALSAAMNNLPQFIQSREGVLTRKGMTYNLNLKDEDLNEFLQSQNKLFTDFSFQFNEGLVTAFGKRGGLSLKLTGHYTIQKKPVNGLIFNVDNIEFNGLKLPESTRKSLDEDFDLGFYPEKIISFLHADKVDTKDGILHVQLSISF
ncbi:hypothetical protein GJB61_22130 [Paenibacillus sp. LC-T2]|uniref:Uncharacterized protein n=1 Tax=Paenibacillus monticola TaxID=2666075 RepID=A0A7X2H8X5_9BACL|nr:hypothetical protein [Paenibacillus monticola]